MPSEQIPNVNAKLVVVAYWFDYASWPLLEQLAVRQPPAVLLFIIHAAHEMHVVQLWQRFCSMRCLHTDQGSECNRQDLLVHGEH